MAYNSTYSTEDVTSASIDGLVVFIITIASLAGIIALILALKYAKKNVK